jgi:hypothetical protein
MTLGMHVLGQAQQCGRVKVINVFLRCNLFQLF